MSKRRLAALLCAAALLFMAAPGLAAGEAVDDLAEVISPRLAEGINWYSAQMEEFLSVPVRVITRHFLGGKNIRAFADETLATLGDERLLLLVMAIGEERYEVAIGSGTRELLSPEKAESLLSAYFREPFLTERNYDKAVAAFLLETGAYLQSRAGVSLPESADLEAYAGRAAARTLPPEATPGEPADNEVPGDHTSWLDGILEDAQRSRDSAEQYAEDVQDAQRGGSRGLSLFQIALIGFVLYKIFGKKRDGRKSGCGPLGWIFGTWGVSRIFRFRK